jgi:pyruvate dehydrogenase E2 component (dihydrolipoamide acetyltransferase)
MGATISLSNFGVLSGRYATPIIVPPQVCILGVGQIQTEAVVKNNKLDVGRVMPLSLSFDHRVATGGEASNFLKKVIDELRK